MSRADRYRSPIGVLEAPQWLNRTVPHNATRSASSASLSEDPTCWRARATWASSTEPRFWPTPTPSPIGTLPSSATIPLTSGFLPLRNPTNSAQISSSSQPANKSASYVSPPPSQTAQGPTTEPTTSSASQSRSPTDLASIQKSVSSSQPLGIIIVTTLLSLILILAGLFFLIQYARQRPRNLKFWEPKKLKISGPRPLDPSERPSDARQIGTRDIGTAVRSNYTVPTPFVAPQPYRHVIPSMEFWQPQQAAWRTPDDRPGAHSYRSASFSAECGETSSPPSAQDQERSYYGRQVNTNDGTDIESSSFSTQDDNTSYDSLLNEYYTPGPIFDIEQGSCPLPELSGLSPWWPEYKYGHDGSVNWTEFIETGFG